MYGPKITVLKYLWQLVVGRHVIAAVVVTMLGIRPTQ